MKGFEHLMRAVGGASSSPMPQMRMDWKAYYLAFCEAHGGFPMQDRGRLLFPDGWTYSSTSYIGPEWGPPEDRQEFLELVQRYWRLRRVLVKNELSYRKQVLEGLQEMSHTRSVPLQSVITIKTGELGQETSETIKGAVDLDSMRYNLQEVVKDLDICEEHIRTLTIELRLLKLEYKNAST